MFSQVFVNKNNKYALRFLWFTNGNIQHQPLSIVREVTFLGQNHHHSVPLNTLRKKVNDNLTGAGQRVTEAVVKNIYVDDSCLSCPSEQEAVN